MQKYDSCIRCFSPLRGADVCPRCQYKQSAYQVPRQALPPFSVLNNRYLLGMLLGYGGFGITYAALDTKTQKRCAIKEYMPSEYASREGNTRRVIPKSDAKCKRIFDHGLNKYTDEAAALKACRSNPVVVDIWDYFKENGTAYIVMEFLDGQDLEHMAKANGGRMDVEFVESALKIVGSALIEIHSKGILHRDIKPENIIYTKSGQFMLLDFGAARDYLRADKGPMSQLLTKGYAPPEQHGTTIKQGEYSDVYALCATAYRLVGGQKPKDSILIAQGSKQPSLYELDKSIPKEFSLVIQKGMAPEIKDRYANFRELLNELPAGKQTDSGKPLSPPPPNPPPSPAPPPSIEPGGQRGKKPSSDIGGGWRPPKLKKGQRVQPNQGNDGGNNPPPKGPEKAGLPPPPRQPAPRSNKAVVVVLSGAGKGTQQVIEPSTMLQIGRQEGECQLAVKGDSNISRIHCCLGFDEEQRIFYLMDKSFNGTFLANGTRLVKDKYYPLKPGETFYLCNSKNLLKVDVVR